MYMVEWITQIAKTHRQLRGEIYAPPGTLAQKELLWGQFSAECDACVRTFSSLEGRPLFLNSETREGQLRHLGVAERNPDLVVFTITFNELAGRFEVKDTATGRTIRLRLVLDVQNEVRIEYRDRFFSPEEAVRIALAPKLFGIEVYVQRGLREWQGSD
jgi:hypothetical protein